MMRSKQFRKSLVSFLSIVGLCILLTGCSGVTSEKENNPTDKSVESESPANIFANESSQQSLGSFSFGPVSDNNDDRDIYEYNGKDIRIPFQVAGTDKGVNSEFGLLVFLDGVPQPYRIERVMEHLVRNRLCINSIWKVKNPNNLKLYSHQ